jgi:hypothetical protein
MKRSKFISMSSRDGNYLCIDFGIIPIDKRFKFIKEYKIYEKSTPIKDNYYTEFEKTREKVQNSIKELVEEIKKDRGDDDIFVLKDALYRVDQNFTAFRKELTVFIDGAWESCSDREILNGAKKLEHIELRFKEIK